MSIQSLFLFFPLLPYIRLHLIFFYPQRNSKLSKKIFLGSDPQQAEKILSVMEEHDARKQKS